MKTIRNALLSLALLCFMTNLSFAQQLYNVHQDNVKPSKLRDYEKIAKEFNDACKEHNVDANWLATSTTDLTYIYVSPIENMAELDERPMAEMAKAMGDKFGEMFDRFDDCYDSHGNYIIVSDETLSYMPDGFTQTQEGQDYRDYFWIYYSPRNGKKIREGMKAVRDMFEAKGSKSHYRVYRNAFGTMDNFYLVAISAKDRIDSAQKEKANNELLGPERFETFDKVWKYADRIEEATGSVRRDLSYYHKKE